MRKLFNVKLKKIRYTIILLYMWTLFAFNTYTVDMANYKSIYDFYLKGNSYSIRSFEIGLKGIYRICAFFQLDYSGVMIVVATIGIILFYFSVKEYTNKYDLVAFLFFLFPFFFQIVTVRHYIALSIVIWGLRFFLDKDYIKFTICLFVAGLFHTSVLLLLILNLAIIDVKNKKRFYMLIAALCLALFLIPKIIPYLVLFFPKFQKYANSGTRFITKIVLIIYYFATIGCAKLLLKYSSNDKKNINLICYKGLLFSFIFIILSMLSMDFFRLYEDVIILLYIILANTDYKKVKIRITDLFYVVSFLIIQFYVFVVQNSWDSVVMDVLTNNSFWR